MRACLIRRISEKVLQVHPLEGPAFLGAAPGTAAPIGQRGQPQRVCTIVREGESYRLRDVSADRRGTLVNHRYVKDAVLASGDEIRVGEAILVFHQIGAGARRARHATGTDLEGEQGTT